MQMYKTKLTLMFTTYTYHSQSCNEIVGHTVIIHVRIVNVFLNYSHAHNRVHNIQGKICQG